MAERNDDRGPWCEIGLCPHDDCPGLFDDDDPDDECVHGWPACEDCEREEADERWSRERDRREARGTADCDGACDPMCDWCLVGHRCPDDCRGGVCPYVALEREQDARTGREGGDRG